MLAALFNGPRKIDLIEYQLPELQPDEVLIKVKACGICGTDFHIFEGKAPAKPPVILGHEYAGEVVETGKDVNFLKTGDHITVNPNIHCGYCYFCKTGKINLCLNLKALGVTMNGGFSEYSRVPVSQAYLIPADYPLEEAAFSEPLSCCIHGLEKAEINLNDNVVIVGCGTIGLLMIQLAKLKGASKVIAVDIVKDKLMLAKSSGADYTLNSSTEDFYSEIIEITSGGADVVIECAGNEKAAATALEIVKKGGKVTIFGLSASDSFLSINLQKFFHKEITVNSSLLNPFTFQKAVDLLVSKKIKVSHISPQKMNLNESDLMKIFSDFRNKSVIKYVLFPNN